jgi:hypothetical protein
MSTDTNTIAHEMIQRPITRAKKEGRVEDRIFTFFPVPKLDGIDISSLRSHRIRRSATTGLSG